MTGDRIIQAERDRQRRVEGFAIKDDDFYIRGQLATAGRYYEIAGDRVAQGDESPTAVKLELLEMRLPQGCWPWDAYWLKVERNPVRCYSKGGALLVAELERIERAYRLGNDTGNVHWTVMHLKDCAVKIDLLMAARGLGQPDDYPGEHVAYCPACCGISQHPEVKECRGCVRCDYHGTMAGYIHMRELDAVVSVSLKDMAGQLPEEDAFADC